jgi:hypothetical protein
MVISQSISDGKWYQNRNRPVNDQYFTSFLITRHISFVIKQDKLLSLPSSGSQSHLTNRAMSC